MLTARAVDAYALVRIKIRFALGCIILIQKIRLRREVGDLSDVYKKKGICQTIDL